MKSFFLIVISSFTLFAEEGVKPSWITDPGLRSDGLVVVGIGESTNMIDALKSAKHEGWRELIENISGVMGVATVSSDSNMNDELVTSKTQLSTGLVEVKSIKTLNKYFEKIENGNYRCYVMLFLSNSEIARVKKSATHKKTGNFLSRVNLTSNPTGAQIKIDGEGIGVTPMTLALPPKAYSLEVIKDGYKKLERQLNCEIEKDQSVSLDLKQTEAKLKIKITPPNALIYVDEELRFTNGKDEITLSEGTHTLEFKKEGFASQSTQVILRADKTMELAVTLQEQKSEPVVNTTPDPRRDEPDWNDKAVRLMKGDEWGDLVEHCLKWIEAEPYIHNAYYYAGMGYLKLQRTSLAIQYLEKAVRIRKDRYSYSYLCEAYNQNAEYSKAIYACERSLELDVKNVNAYLALAEAYRGNRDYRKAYGNYKVALSLNHNYKNYFINFCKETYFQYEDCNKVKYPSLYGAWDGH